MLAVTLLSSALFLSPPPGTPAELGGRPGLVCVAPAPAPSDVKVSYFSGDRPDGVSYLGASSTYTLSTGDVGEAHIVIDAEGFGEAYFAINGDIVSHTTIEYGEIDGPRLSSWHPPSLNYSAELVAELIAGATDDLTRRMIPEPIKCSDFGRKATKATKWLFRAAKYATAAACCTLSAGSACVVCAAGTLLAGDAVEEALDGHCN